MADTAVMLAAIEATLLQLYTKLHRTLTQKDRSMVLQDISVLEKSRDYWSKQQSAADGTRPRLATIDLTGFRNEDEE
jgi:hypothetical protein